MGNEYEAIASFINNMAKEALMATALGAAVVVVVFALPVLGGVYVWRRYGTKRVA